MIAKCPLCSSTETEGNWRYKSYNIHHCRDCDLEFCFPLKRTPLKHYQENHTYKYMKKSIMAEGIPSGYYFLIDKIKEIAHHFLSPSQASIVDIGCGPGFLLKDLVEEGYDCLGFDFNSDMLHIASDHYKIPTKLISVEDLHEYNERRFNMCILSHVLEHLLDPVSALNKIQHIISPGGIIFIDLPNRNYFRTKKSLSKGSLPEGNYPPHHLTFWSEKALRRCLEISNFSILDCGSRPYPEVFQTQHTIKYKYRITNRSASKFLARIASFSGQTLRLQGSTIYAVARVEAGNGTES